MGPVGVERVGHDVELAHRGVLAEDVMRAASRVSVEIDDQDVACAEVPEGHDGGGQPVDGAVAAPSAAAGVVQTAGQRPGDAVAPCRPGRRVHPPVDARSASTNPGSHSSPPDAANPRGCPVITASTYSGSWILSRSSVVAGRLDQADPVDGSVGEVGGEEPGFAGGVEASPPQRHRPRRSRRRSTGALAGRVSVMCSWCPFRGGATWPARAPPIAHRAGQDGRLSMHGYHIGVTRHATVREVDRQDRSATGDADSMARRMISATE